MQYNGTRIGLSRGGSLGDCCTACIKELNCAVYNWHPVGAAGQETFCELQSADGAAVPSSPSSNFSAGVPSAHIACESETDCSLAGECVDGRCLCDGWTSGDHCEILNLLPVDAARPGYRNSSGYNTWGGASIAAGDGKYYLFLSQMAGKCPLLGHWAEVSEGVRLVAEAPNGPFSAPETILPSFAHNIKPFRAPDGTWLVYYIGEPNGRTANCSQAPPGAAPGPAAAAASGAGAMPPPVPTQTAGPIMVASAPRPDAPASEWKAHGPLTDSESWHSATNPSPLFFPNGSVLLAVSRAWAPGGKRTTLMRADSWRGPYTNVTHGFGGSIGNGEDPGQTDARAGGCAEPPRPLINLCFLNRPVPLDPRVSYAQPQHWTRKHAPLVLQGWPSKLDRGRGW